MSITGRLFATRRMLYARGMFRSAEPPIPVVSIGNLAWGGTGKTPLVAYLSGELLMRGIRVAIVSRGYRRSTSGVRVVSDGRNRLLSASESGDEPYLLARRLPAALVIVAESRIDGVRRAADFGATLAVLDDGFQHLPIRRHVDIVTLDSARPVSGGVPPFGRLREPPTVLAAADIIVFTRARPGRPASEREIAPFIAGKPVFHVHFRFAGWRDEAGEPIAVPARDIAALAVCGIGNPDSFRKTLSAAGAASSEVLIFRDHHRYSRRDLDRIESAARRLGASVVLTTEKDQVKIAGRTSCPVLAARIEPEFLEEGFIEAVLSMLRRRGVVV